MATGSLNLTSAPGQSAPSQLIVAELIAVLVAVTGGEPRVMTIREGESLPSGALEPGHRSLQSGLRAWVERQTHHPLGYVEQLYTFADRDRAGGEDARRVISISYLGLTREKPDLGVGEAGWRGWYDYFPWEDHRSAASRALADELATQLLVWARGTGDPDLRDRRRQRVSIAFGLDEGGWNEELILQRYELLYEAGLIPEAARPEPGRPSRAGRPMMADHRRILATGIARLRAKIKYRPVVFELMPQAFTLLQLQRSVEALAGRLLHKQNFRRLIEQQALVEETGEIASDTGGRPAKLFRFRKTILAERAIAGSKLPLSRP